MHFALSFGTQSKDLYLATNPRYTTKYFAAG
jgi:hypothetical protein